LLWVGRPSRRIRMSAYSRTTTPAAKGMVTVAATMDTTMLTSNETMEVLADAVNSPPDPLMVALRALLQGSVNEEDQGVRALSSGDFGSAVTHFRKGVELDPDNPGLRHKLGTALQLSGDSRGAFEQFEETIRRSPGFSQAHYSLGVLLAQSGRLPAAVDELAAAVQLDPEFPQARYGYALALAQTKRYEEARKQLAEGAARFPDHREFADALAQLK